MQITTASDVEAHLGQKLLLKGGDTLPDHALIVEVSVVDGQHVYFTGDSPVDVASLDAYHLAPLPENWGRLPVGHYEYADAPSGGLLEFYDVASTRQDPDFVVPY